MPVVINGTTGISGVDGSAGTPAVQGTDTNTGVFFPAADTIAFSEGGTEVARFDSSGNLGIGTSSPSTLLHTSGTVTSNVATGNVAGYVMSVNGTATGFLGSSASGTTLDSRGATFLSFQTNGTERARIDSSGNLLVGGTTVLNSARQTIYSTSGIVTVGRNTFTTAGKFWNTPYIDSNNTIYIINQNNAGVYMTDGATSWSANSDERLKDIIEPIGNAADKVASLRAVIGRYKTDDEDKRRSFLIAQDVEAVLPEAVSKSRLPNSTDETEYLAVSYTDTIPLLVAAIQEQQAIIEQLKADVAALKGQA